MAFIGVHSPASDVVHLPSDRLWNVFLALGSEFNYLKREESYEIEVCLEGESEFVGIEGEFTGVKTSDTTSFKVRLFGLYKQ